MVIECPLSTVLAALAGHLLVCLACQLINPAVLVLALGTLGLCDCGFLHLYPGISGLSSANLGYLARRLEGEASFQRQQGGG